MKIDLNTITFFLQKQYNSFPLLKSTLKYYNYPDPMIKNTVRNVILNLLKLEYEPINTFFCTLPIISYFPCLICKLRDLILKLNTELTADDHDHFNNIYDEILDDILYFQDIFSLGNKRINLIITNTMFYYLILPILIQSVVSNKPRISINVSLFILTLFFKYIKDNAFLNMIHSILFLANINRKLELYINECPNAPINYYFDWNQEYKNSKNVSFTKYIALNFSDPFIKSLIFKSKSPFSEIKVIVKKYENQNDDVQRDSLYKNLLGDVLDKMPGFELDNMQAYHKTMSISTGINVGLITQDYRKHSVIRIFYKLYEEIKAEIDDKTKIIIDIKDKVDNEYTLIKNNFNEHLFDYLKSKDDSLILLSNLAFNSIFKNSNISKELMTYTNLYIDNEIENDKETKETESSLDSSKKEAIIEIDVTADKGDSISSTTSTNITKTTLVPEIKYDIYNNTEFFKQLFGFACSNSNSYNNFKINNTNPLIENLLNLLIIADAHFRTITIRLIIENLNSLINGFYKKDFNTNGNNNTLLELLNKVYYSFLSKIKLMMLNNAFIKEIAFELLTLEWKEYIKDFEVAINEIVASPYLLIPINLVDEIEDYPIMLKNPKNEKEIFKGILIIFMGLHDLRYKILETKNNKKYPEPLKNALPGILKIGGTELNISQSYDYKELNIEFTTCKMKTSVHKTFIPVNIIVYKHNLIIVFPETENENRGIVKYKYSLRSLELQVDRSEPRSLNVFYVKEGQYIDMVLSFEDSKKPLVVKQLIEENRTVAWNTEISSITKYFDDLLTNFDKE